MAYLYKDLQWEVIFKHLEKDAIFHLRDKGATPNKNVSSPMSPYDAQSLNIDEKLLEGILKNSYMNADKLAMIQMAFNTVLMQHLDEKKSQKINELDFPYMNNSILKLLNSFKLAGNVNNKTSEGYALFTSFKKAKDLLIIKTAKNKEENFHILYEYFIGTMGINKLRKLVPNFAYTLGLFNCSALEIKENKVNFENFCKNDGNDIMHYIIYEKIPGQSMKEFVLDMKDEKDFERLLSYILQLLIALEIAQQEICFTHYDLHTDNIILRPLGKFKHINYKLNGKMYSIYTDAIPTIIDMGFAHFVYEDMPFGMVDMDHLGIIPSITSGGYDVYKFLMYIISNTRFVSLKNSSNPKMIKFFDKIKWILNFFQDFEDPYQIHEYFYNDENEELEKAFIKGGKNFFSILPINNKLFNMSPLSLFNWMINTNKDANNIVMITKEEVTEKTLLEKYQTKVDIYDLFNTSLNDNIQDYMRIKNNKSYIINSYITSELSTVIKHFSNKIINKDDIKIKLKEINDVTKKHKKKYKQNDEEVLEILQKELQKDYLLKNFHGKNFKVLETIHRHDLSSIKNYVESYINYTEFINYSKYTTSPLKSNNKYFEKYQTYKKYLKDFYLNVSEKLFQSIRKKLIIINTYLLDEDDEFIHPENLSIEPEFVLAMEKTLLYFDLVKIFFPTLGEFINNLYKFILKLIGMIREFQPDKKELLIDIGKANGI